MQDILTVQKRFKTAGAKIPYSRKIPSDFFQRSSHQNHTKLNHSFSRDKQNFRKTIFEFTFMQEKPKLRHYQSPMKESKSINTFLPEIKANKNKFNIEFGETNLLKSKKNHLSRVSIKNFKE